ncbi:MAG: thioredoxin [Sphingobacteriales bacterium]|jgi:thioredoxin|nr:MAG: thioredoxin [Sphingobacteriales bacterium]
MKNIILASLFIFNFIGCNSNNNKQNDTEVIIAKNVDVNEFEKLISSNNDAQLIDVRTEGEFITGFIPKAKNINFNNPNFAQEISKLDKNKPVYVYCLSGGRSSSAMKVMQQQGFKQVYNLQGGIMSWKGNSKAIELPKNNNPSDDSTITLDAYKQLISKNKLVLVDFYAPWCAPCKILSPIVESVEKEMNGTFKLEKLNYDNCNELVKPLQISSIPLIILYKNGQEVWRKKGISTKDEITMIIELNMREK